MFDVKSVPNRFDEKMVESLLLAAEELDFYGVDDDTFCIGIGGSKMVLEAVPDPDDGYRSYFGCFATKHDSKIFFSRPIAKVRMKAGGISARSLGRYPGDTDTNFGGWILEDIEDGHVWLTVGTDYGDDYYPCFTFRYQPKKGSQ